MAYNGRSTLCGCWYLPAGYYERQYLPLVDLKSHTTILATTSRTKLTQTFHNSHTKDKLDEVQYTFPLYDGVSVVSFKCTVAGRTITGVVKEKQQARTEYQAAVDSGQTAGLLEQVPEASDAHTTKIGNIPANEHVTVEIEYLGELKHDAETDGSRFTIPTVMAPRYGFAPATSHSSVSSHGISISVDIAVDDGSVIRGVQSPSHPIAVTMGRTSTTDDEDSFDNHQASATLTLGTTVLEKDFVIIVLAKGQDTPRALLETHSTIPNQRALMTTLVPKFNLPSIHPEIVFVVDRSGSMEGKMSTLVAALKVFLKSLPVGVKFNICSFGTHHDLMFSKSKTYDQSSLQEALDGVNGFAADFGGTEMYSAIEATFKNRLPGMSLEVLVLTDGQIWNQEQLFEYIRKSCIDSPLRVFSLGIGSGASSSLVEGIARSGDGFAQFVDDNEKMDKRVVRMLKAALSPHIKDYKLEVKYAKAPDSMEDDYEIIESVESGISKLVIDKPKSPATQKKTISLFNVLSKETPTNPAAGRYDHLPSIATPAILQAPHNVPALYPFHRTTVYLLLGPNACQQIPSSVVLRATSEHGPLELEIPVQDIGLGQTIHQLAAKKAVHEIEQGRGWLSANDFKQKLIGTQCESRMDEIIEREAVRLGVEFQVGGKFCSFVAVEDGVEQVSAPQREPVVFEKRSLSSSTSMRSRSGMSLFGGFGSHFGSPTTASAASQPRRQLASKAARPSAPSGGPLFGASVMSPELSKRSDAAYGQPESKRKGRKSAYNLDSSNVLPPMALQQQIQARRTSNCAFDAPAPPAAAIAPPYASYPGSAFGGTQADRGLHRDSSASFTSLDDGENSMAEDDDNVSSPDIASLSNEDKVRALIDLNNFDGSWAMSAQLVQILGPDWEAIKEWKRAGWDEMQQTTAMVVAFLEVKMAEERDVWEMVVEKARYWLVASVKNDAEEGVDAVKSLLGGV